MLNINAKLNLCSRVQHVLYLYRSATVSLVLMVSIYHFRSSLGITLSCVPITTLFIYNFLELLLNITFRMLLGGQIIFCFSKSWCRFHFA